MEATLTLALAVLACAALYALSRLPKRRAPRTVASLRRELDRLTHDARSSESLLAREQARSPESTELERLETVLRRLRRERRR
ncbi:MAG: hypothetical protein ACK6CU_17465 [Deltaproteobacteria bacterium]|jgi:hypothetical protein